MLKMDWRASKKSLTDKIKHLWKNSLMSDARVVHRTEPQGDRVSIPAHKFVLAVNSAVFCQMFYGNNAQSSDVVEIGDITIGALEEFLRFLYCDEVHIAALDSARELLFLSRKYDVPALRRQCLAHLSGQVGPSTVFQTLPLAQEHGDEQLVRRCWGIVCRHSEECLGCEGFLGISKSLLLEMIKRDDLSVREIDLFKAVERWCAFQMARNDSPAASSKRDLLGDDFFQLIMFEAMSLEDFARHVPESGLLRDDELVRLFVSLSPANPAVRRSCHARPRSGALRRCVRFGGTCRWFVYEGSSPERVSFSVDAPVCFFGVRLYGSENCRYNATLRMYESSTAKPEIAHLQGDYSCNVQNNQDYSGFDLTLDTPVPLMKNVLYIVEAMLRGPPSCYGTAGKSAVRCGDVTFNFGDDRCPVFANFRAGQFAEVLYFDQH